MIYGNSSVSVDLYTLWSYQTFVADRCIVYYSACTYVPLSVQRYRFSMMGSVVTEMFESSFRLETQEEARFSDLE